MCKIVCECVTAVACGCIFCLLLKIVNHLVRFKKLGTNLMPLWATAATFGHYRTAAGVFSTLFVTVTGPVVSFVRKIV